jgi:predicted alpha/beta superfamily hydrolase
MAISVVMGGSKITLKFYMTFYNRLFSILFPLFSLSSFSQTPLVSSGTINHLDLFQSKYVNARNIDIWLPQGYSSSKKYAVVYMQDGKSLFDTSITWNKQEWRVDETITQLLNERKIKDCIVVGIWNGEINRGSEYFPEQAVNLLSQTDKEKFLAAKFNGYSMINGKFIGDSYLRFIVEELKPFIDTTYSVYTDQRNTYIIGSSYGALISLYAVCQYPNVFGGAACLSTHWPGIAEDNDYIPKALQDYLSKHLPGPKNHKIYFDYGTVMPDSWYKAHQQKVDSIMKTKGYDKKNWITKEFFGDDHSEKSWSNRFYIPISFLLTKEER